MLLGLLACAPKEEAAPAAEATWPAAWCAALDGCDALAPRGWDHGTCQRSLTAAVEARGFDAEADAACAAALPDAACGTVPDACADLVREDWTPTAGARSLAEAGRVLTGEEANTATGGVLAVVDPDGTGELALIVGAYAHDGAVYVERPIGSGAITGSWGRVDGGREDGLGASVDVAGDFTGDGRVDLVTVAGGVDVDGTEDVGAALIFDGVPAGRATADDAAARITGDWTDSGFSMEARTLGDTDGDGVDELALVSWVGSGGGGTYYWLDVFAGPLAADATRAEADARFALGYSPPHPIARQDLDGDGHDDLVFGAPNYSAVGVVFGPLPHDGDLGQPDAVVLGEGDHDFGRGLAGPGDLDGDGAADLVVGAPSYSAEDAYENGAVYVVHGPIEGTIEAADPLRGPSEGDRLGDVLAVADVDGDGAPDLVASAFSARPTGRVESGTVWLVPDLLGATAIAEGSPLFGVADGEAPGRALAVADLDGDGALEIAVGAPSATGAVYLYGME